MNLKNRNTELRNPKTVNIDNLSTSEILYLMNDEDRIVSEIVRESIDSISTLIDSAYESLINGGRVFYIGAGTSGRLGILDASECPPTFGVSPETIIGIIAGGSDALQKAIEGAEDDINQAIKDLKSNNITDRDFLIGIASSGTTPYVKSALKYAKKNRIKTGSITCSYNNEISKIVDFPIEIITGPEVITGSTRLKAGTAQKLVLNMISTTLMTKLGKVYSNYMVDLKITNKKLYQRAINILMEVLKIDELKAKEVLKKSNNSVKAAIIMNKLSVTLAESEQLLENYNGRTYEILKEVN